MSANPPLAPLGATAVRSSWSSIPARLREAITGRLGAPVAAAADQTGGFTPGMAVVLTLDDSARVFVKAMPASHPLAGAYEREAQTVASLPERVPAPRLRWHAEIEGWLVLAFDGITGRHPDFASGSTYLGAVIAAVTAISAPPAVLHLPASPDDQGRWLHGWASMVDDMPADLPGWVQHQVHDLVSAERGWVAAAGGRALVHCDVCPDNLIITERETAMVVDWSHATRGAGWPDIADLVPHMIMAGSSPTEAEARLAHTAAWTDAEPEVLTSYAIAYAGYWTRASRLPAPPGVPHLRNYQRMASEAALRWVLHRRDARV